MSGLWLPLAIVAAILLAVGAIGYGLAGAFFSAAAGRTERAGWGFAIGLALLAASVPLAFAVDLPPRGVVVLLSALAVAAAWFLHRHRGKDSMRGRDRGGIKALLTRSGTLLLLLIAFGAAVFALRALTEPMWSNDYLAIWGFKGKTLFGAGGVPRRLFTDPAIGFSHPEYPLGLPFLFAALSFLLGRWDDHAMALLFPFLQVATLFALFGWLRRRGVARTVALSAAALLANFGPLYSAFLTGMADIPQAFVTLLFGTALVDALDELDAFAVRRLALAAALAVSTKNDGALLAAAGFLLCLVPRGWARAASRRAAAAVAAPAVLLLLVGRLWKGNLPLRDFDFGLLGPTLVLELLPRVAEAIHVAFREVILPSWPGLLCVMVLLAAGRPTPAGDRLLLLALLCALAYLLAPAIAVLGPDWLIRASFARTVSALAPLAAAGIALRLRSLKAGAKGRDPEQTEGG